MAKYQRRSPEKMIADLEAKIGSIRSRAERKKAKTNPAVRQVLLAVKAIDKAMAATADATMRTALQEARATLSACVAIHGVVVPASAAATQTTTVRQKTRAREAVAR